jgi:uncharacterized protein
MYLVDSNVWLELLLEQERADDVRQFFQVVEARYLSLTEFSLYSIGIILTRLNKDAILRIPIRHRRGFWRRKDPVGHY